MFEQVCRELEAGKKRTHWMWFIFPQLRSLGQSPTAQHFGLDGLEEARAYLSNPLLGPRLVECAKLVIRVEGKTAHEIFSSPDDLKFRSCMTLFAALQQQPFQQALDKHYEGRSDPRTLDMLHGSFAQGKLGISTHDT